MPHVLSAVFKAHKTLQICKVALTSGGVRLIWCKTDYEKWIFKNDI